MYIQVLPRPLTGGCSNVSIDNAHSFAQPSRSSLFCDLCARQYIMTVSTTGLSSLSALLKPLACPAQGQLKLGKVLPNSVEN